MSRLKQFTVASARPLPVIVLADTSGSMTANGNIDALNTALREMLSTFAQEDEGQAQLSVCIITFGGVAAVHQQLAPPRDINFMPLVASGMTPMGAAFDLARELLEDKERLSGRAYTPALILLSDGQPNDEWESALDRLLASERAKKAQRFALGIGDADPAVLRRFLSDPEARVYAASDARDIRKFFRFVTMSVAARSRSTTPNAIVSQLIPSADLDVLL